MQFAPSHSSETSDRSPGEVLAAQLDRQIIDGPHPWMVHVLGVHSDDRDVWMQIAPADDVTASVVLRLSRRATAAHAVASLALGRPVTGSYPHVIQVMRGL